LTSGFAGTSGEVATIVRAVAAGARFEGEFVERLRGEGLALRARYAREDRSTVTG
jgi:hypothetical protein